MHTRARSRAPAWPRCRGRAPCRRQARRPRRWRTPSGSGWSPGARAARCSSFRARRVSSSQELVDRGIRIDLAIRDARDRGVKARLADAALELAEQGLLQERLNLAAGGGAPALEMIAGLPRPGAMPVDGLDELRQSVARLRRRAEDRTLPRAILREREHLREIARGVVRTGTVRLVHDEHVGDLEDARLDRLDVVAESRHGHQADGIDDADDIDLLLTHADGLDENDVGTEGIEHVDDARRRAREAAGVPAARHRTDEDAVVEEPFAHPDAISEDRAAAE